MPMIGEILVAQGHLTPDALEEALDWQVLYGGRLGTNLLELKLADEEQLARALGKQLGAEVAFGDLDVDPAVVELIPKHVADRQEIVPWKMEKRRLKVLCAAIDVQQLDQLSYKIGHNCVPVIAPEFRIFQLLRAHYGAMRQMRALDFGVVPEEGRAERRRKKEREHGAVEPAPELIDEGAFNDIYRQMMAGKAAAKAAAVVKDEQIPDLPDDAILEELPEDAILGPAQPEPQVAIWDSDPPRPARDESPLDFRQALQALSGVTDRDEIAHLVLRASRSKAARALLLQVQGGVVVGWDGLGEGMENSRAVAMPLKEDSAFALVVRTRSHYLGPLQKTAHNIRFLGTLGKKVPKSSLIFPILHRGRVSHMLYLDNGHKQQAPTDVGEMLILSQRISQTVEELVARKRKGGRA